MHIEKGIVLAIMHVCLCVFMYACWNVCCGCCIYVKAQRLISGVFLGYSAPYTLSQVFSLSQELMDSVSLVIQLAPGMPQFCPK